MYAMLCYATYRTVRVPNRIVVASLIYFTNVVNTTKQNVSSVKLYTLFIYGIRFTKHIYIFSQYALIIIHMKHPLLTNNPNIATTTLEEVHQYKAFAKDKAVDATKSLISMCGWDGAARPWRPML
jgi:hypothetical protein